jgi:hypothetical protein
MTASGDRQPIYQLEIRPEMRGSVELRMLVKALLAAAREELEWAERADAEARKEVRADPA